ncbi:RNA-binding protein fusilli [Melipona quadrifasciata]|uniref:RNA-binding protein fusilli n=1 Tax=Melipona quadrifasciata TaxID=166423 RepID=A0A0M8ZR04_9HYME|nr:RNA-binding protein fusilli [Melipona quadrifasciata]
MQTTGTTRGPTHLVALYVATAGLQGNALGSDEEEITLLVYVLIDVQQNKVCFHNDDSTIQKRERKRRAKIK